MAEMERLAAQLPQGFGFEWTGQSREEKLAGSQAIVLYAFAILAVFLCLAALYESWSIPLAVILVVPLGVLGVLLATLLRGYANDVYFQVGLITIIGLSAKNAILIIEFAKDLQAQGKGVIESALAAAHLRFRPIVMTSMAFTLGVLPLAIAIGRGLGQPARHRHRRDRRHPDRHRAGGVVRADLLRGGARPVQGQPRQQQHACRAGRAHGGAFR
jgi:multidrug efflux pump